jgi:two-component system response regulator AtoC
VNLGQRDRDTELRIAIDAADRLRFSLLVMSEHGVFTYPLPDSGIVRIGRATQCEVSIDDGQLSREHARLVLGASIAIEDLASSNGTRLGAQALVPHRPTPLPPGEHVSMGGTVLVLQHAAAEARSRQLWSHGYFESRLEEECARAEQRKTTFAILGVRFDARQSARELEARLSASVSADHVVACYAPWQYEVLLTDVDSAEARREAAILRAKLAEGGPAPEVNVACYARDGRTPEALLAVAWARGRDDDAPEIAPGGALDRLRSIAERFAEGTIPVLVLGETGVGKDVLASMLHRASRRANEPYVCINCGALPDSLLESELFGHERGAFTGANAAKAGLLESARGGTVLLDEVAELPLAAQASLLRVLDQGEVLRLGATRPRPIDARFIAATNRDLELEVERGRFRQDLYFRLAAATIVIPPLRERVAEIAPLALRFVRDACRERAQPRVPRILPEAMEVLLRHAWPGNVRELRNAIERAVLLAREDDIGLEHLPLEKMGRRLPSPGASFARRPSEALRAVVEMERSNEATRRISTLPPRPASTDVESSPGAPLYVSARVDELVARDPEAAKLLAALDACGWNQARTATTLGVSLRTLVSRLSAYGLTRKRTR